MKITITQAIEKAIEGGCDLNGHYQNRDGLGYPTWKYEDGFIYFRQTVIGFGGDPTRHEWHIALEQILLSPAFWQALGKVEAEKTVFKYRKPTQEDWALNMMHRMIDALAEGKTIESFFESL